MSYITNNYTTLIRDGDIIQEIKPNVGFDTIAIGCINTSYCRINDSDGNFVIEIKAGATTEPIKDSAKQDLSKHTAQQLRELCIDSSLSFKKKATKQELINVLNGGIENA